MFNDIIKNLQFDLTAALATLLPVATALIGSCLMGLLIYWVYGKAFRGVVFNHRFSITLGAMTVLSAMITLAISSNIALSLGMVGALSIIRYRTAIKDPMDILFLFWAVGTGITIGAKQIYLASLGAVIVILMLFILNQKAIRNTIYILLVHYSGEDLDEQLRKILHRVRYQIKSKTVRQKDTELAIEVAVHRDNLAFMEAVKSLPAVKDVSLIQYDGEYHG